MTVRRSRTKVQMHRGRARRKVLGARAGVTALAIVAALLACSKAETPPANGECLRDVDCPGPQQVCGQTGCLDVSHVGETSLAKVLRGEEPPPSTKEILAQLSPETLRDLALVDWDLPAEKVFASPGMLAALRQAYPEASGGVTAQALGTSSGLSPRARTSVTTPDGCVISSGPELVWFTNQAVFAAVEASGPKICRYASPGETWALCAAATIDLKGIPVPSVFDEINARLAELYALGVCGGRSSSAGKADGGTPTQNSDDGGCACPRKPVDTCYTGIFEQEQICLDGRCCFDGWRDFCKQDSDCCSGSCECENNACPGNRCYCKARP